MATQALETKVYRFNVSQDQVLCPVPHKVLVSSTGAVLAIYSESHCEPFKDVTEFLECFSGGCLSENDLRERLVGA